MAPPVFTGGSLSFKGDKSKATRKKGRKSKHKILDENVQKDILSLPTESDDLTEANDLTEAERKALKYKDERARKELQSVANKSHRERVEEFNEKLGNLTELNDIPRVRFYGLVEFDYSSKVMLTVTLFSITGQCCRKWIGIDCFPELMVCLPCNTSNNFGVFQLLLRLIHSTFLQVEVDKFCGKVLGALMYVASVLTINELPLLYPTTKYDTS